MKKISENVVPASATSCRACGLTCRCKGKCLCTDCACGKYAAFFDTLGNHNRMRIVGSLREQSRSVSEIIAETGLEQTCVSHCLRKLTDGNFVTVRRDGKRRIYSLHKNMTPLLALIERHVEGTP